MTTETQASEPIFGVVLTLAGTKVILHPKSDLKKINEEGFETGLPDGMRVNLGKVGKDINKIVGQFLPDFDIHTSLGSYEGVPILETLIDKLKHAVVHAELGLEELHIKVPPKHADSRKPEFRLGLSVTWDDEGESLIEGLPIKLNGLLLNFSNSEVTATAASGQH